MANQYTGSFEHIVRAKFNCSAKEILQQCANKGMTYQQAEKMLGFKHGTIRKWANRYGIKLKAGTAERAPKRNDFMRLFKNKAMNKYNVLSRCWVMHKSSSS